jgi:hypothetical protein
MQVQIAIGENHRFELREALLVYHGNQTTFITKHEVTPQQNTAALSDRRSRSPWHLWSRSFALLGAELLPKCSQRTSSPKAIA